MAAYLIEIPHGSTKTDCLHVMKIFAESGSHLLAKTYWGCPSGVHKSWFISEFGSREEALQIIPAFLRPNASIIELITLDKVKLH